MVSIGTKCTWCWMDKDWIISLLRSSQLLSNQPTGKLFLRIWLRNLIKAGPGSCLVKASESKSPVAIFANSIFYYGCAPTKIGVLKALQKFKADTITSWWYYNLLHSKQIPDFPTGGLDPTRTQEYSECKYNKNIREQITQSSRNPNPTTIG